MTIQKSGTLFLDKRKSAHENSISNANTSVEDAARKQMRDMIDVKRKLAKLAIESRILYEATSVFPFQLFPDKIIIEFDKITVVHRTFAWKNIFPIPIDMLNNVNVTRNLIFASLSIEIHGFEQNPDDINYLRPLDAARIKRLVMGLISAKKAGIDVTKVPINELINDLEEIGSTSGDIETLPMA